MGYKTIYIETLGCSKNQVDSEKMLALLEDEGYKIVETPEIAQIIIVNTCGFIAPAREEAIETILSLSKYKEEGQCKLLVVAGCLAERYGEELEKEFTQDEVDLIFGVRDISQIIQAIKNNKRLYKPTDYADNLVKRKLTTFPGTAYLRISDGCSNNCAYCAIPIIRGSLRSRPIEDILEELQLLMQTNNIREIIIISQDTSNYGIDLYGRQALTELLEKISAILPEKVWLRVLYMHPDHITNTMLQELSKNKHFIPYFDIPFQSGSSSILKAMGRRGDKETYLALLEQIRSLFPDAIFRSTFIVGFPGETEEDFQETIDFIKKASIHWVGAFAYSDEEDTKAWSYEHKISEEDANERLSQLKEIADEISVNLLKKLLGSKLLVW